MALLATFTGLSGRKMAKRFRIGLRLRGCCCDRPLRLQDGTHSIFCIQAGLLVGPLAFLDLGCSNQRHAMVGGRVDHDAPAVVWLIQRFFVIVGTFNQSRATQSLCLVNTYFSYLSYFCSYMR